VVDSTSVKLTTDHWSWTDVA